MIVAQLTDIHAAPGNDNLARFARTLEWLEFIQPDALVVTGDLVDDDWFAGYAAIASLLKGQHCPVFLLPGNADNHAMMRACWESEAWMPDALHFSVEVKGLRLIGVDTTLKGEAAGSIIAHLAWLERQLAGDDGLPVLLFLHHHVFPSGIPTMDKIMCRGSGELAALLTDYAGRTLAIASGHVHRPIASHLAGVPAYICGSVCPANPAWFGGETVPPANDPPSLMLHRFAAGLLTSYPIFV